VYYQANALLDSKQGIGSGSLGTVSKFGALLEAFIFSGDAALNVANTVRLQSD
jgi:hypothetical protein